jgi:SAM-dependent methyltransferase
MLAALPRSIELVGVDLALRWLVVARKRLDQLGIQATLICANAEALPFRDGSAAAVTMDSALEHFGDQGKAASEAHRVLETGGVWMVATPNRWSLGPDPHIGVPLGGYLPSRQVAAIARRRRALPPVRRLLGAAGLRRLMRRSGFSPVRVVAPPIGAAQRSRLGSGGRRLVDLANGLGRVPVGNAVLRAVGPLLAAVGRKA